MMYTQTLAELYEIAPEDVVAKFDQKQRKGHAKGDVRHSRADGSDHAFLDGARAVRF